MPALAVAPTTQKLVEEAAFSVIADALVVMSEYINGTDPDIDVVQKLLNSKVADMGKTIPVKDANPLAGLQVVHITIGRGGIQMTVEPPAPVAEPLELVEEVRFVGEDDPAKRHPMGISQILPVAEPAPLARVPMIDAAVDLHAELMDLLQ